MQIMAPAQVPPSDPSRVEEQSRPGQRARNLAIASGVAGVAVLAIGLILWAGSSPPTPAAGPEGSRPVMARAPAPSVPPPRDAEAAPTQGAGSREAAPESPSNLREPVSSRPDQSQLRIMVPAYFYPSGPTMKEWDRLIDAAAQVPIVAIANPGTGPGESSNPEYFGVINHAALRGVTVIGYVDTRYANRGRQEVEADVDRWVSFYPEIRGIFFDAQAERAGHADYYAALRQYVRQKLGGQALVVTNPGTVCAEEYVQKSVADFICVFEYFTGFDHFRLPQWADRYPGGRFAAFPYQIPNSEQMRDCIQLAALRGIGAIYVSDSEGSNRWGRLPIYWDAEVDAVRRVNRHEAP
jgi:hypothetical protein